MYLKRARTGDYGGFTVRHTYQIFTLSEYSGGAPLSWLSVSLRARVTLFQSWTPEFEHGSTWVTTPSSEPLRVLQAQWLSL